MRRGLVHGGLLHRTKADGEAAAIAGRVIAHPSCCREHAGWWVPWGVFLGPEGKMAVQLSVGSRQLAWLSLAFSFPEEALRLFSQLSSLLWSCIHSLEPVHGFEQSIPKFLITSLRKRNFYADNP